jgi:hypothetical protein
MRLWLAILALLIQPLASFPQQPMGGVTVQPSSSKTWTLVQHPINATSCNSTSCSITVSSTGSGHLGVIWIISQNGTGSSISSVSGGGTWVVPSPGTSACSNNTIGASLCAYNLSLSSGVTSISITTNGFMFDSVIEFLEYSWTGGGSATLDTQSSTAGTGVFNTSWPGQSLTLSGSSDVIVQGISLSDGPCSSITSPYTNPADFTASSAGTGWLGIGGSINTSSGSAPTWSCSSTELESTGAIAFK